MTKEALQAKTANDSIVRLDQVSLTYHSPEAETPALRDITLDIARGEFVAIVGPSGCGKSSVLSIIAGLIPPSGGGASVLGKPVAGTSESVGYMLQRDNLFEWRTIRQNARLGLEVCKKVTPESIDFVETMLADYGLAEFHSHYPRELSGGMRQKAALIRTLALDPPLLLLDEPFSALDYQTRLALSDELIGILRGKGKTAILVTHDISEAISMSDRVLVFSKRPSTIKCEIAIELPRTTALERRRAPRFQEYFNLIWKELDVHVD